MSNADFLLALKLQNELKDLEEDEDAPIENNDKYEKRDLNNLNITNNLVHPAWEMLDPTPDIHSMFCVFDMKFFQSKLKCVQLEWSARMYSCAGICYQRRSSLGMSCIIRLSQPLLKLRSRKNLVETLLHEMIHAYLFVKGIREGNGGHGPTFKNIMYGINKKAGTNITVYHTFHDEVELYKTHWWRCNGICQSRKPFYGYVKRTSNRAPNSNDRWWLDHQQSCGGLFVKIKEPEKAIKAKENKNVPVQKTSKDIRSFFSNKKTKPKNLPSTVGESSQAIRSVNNIETPIIKKNLKDKVSDNRNNIFGLKDLNKNDDDNSEDEDSIPVTSNRPTFTGIGKPLGGETVILDSPTKNAGESIRDIWCKRYLPTISSTPVKIIDLNSNETKRRKVSENNEFVITNRENNWKKFSDSDDDLFIEENIPETIDLSENSVNNFFADDIINKKEIKTLDRNQMIKEELFDSDDDMDSIILIDDEYNDNLNDAELILSAELADTSVIDDLFGDDTLMTDFVKTSSNTQQTEHHYSTNGIIACPICQQNMVRGSLSSHMEGCLGIVIKVETNTKRGRVVNDKACTSTSVTNNTKLPFYKKKKNSKDLLREAGYSDSDLLNLLIEEDKEPDSVENEINSIQELFQNSNEVVNLTSDGSENDSQEKNSCPVCNLLINANEINEHLDNCLIIDD